METVDSPVSRMARVPPDRMLALDFSGTLSLDAALFARDESLTRALHESGLWDLGVNSLSVFWDGIVNPTWQEGSTTTLGYKSLLYRQVRQLAAASGDAPPDEVVRACASRFVEAYLACSVIDPAWQGAIRRLLRHPGLLIVIATDHYAEATAHIQSQLSSLGLESAPVLQADAQRILVANSADLGYPKASRGFWAAVNQARSLSLTRIVTIDDMGSHEQPLDSYASRERVARRTTDTLEAISSVFPAPISPFFFGLSEPVPGFGSKDELLRQYRRLVRQAERFAARALAG